jgi:putative FmdB family regulatory protein
MPVYPHFCPACNVQVDDWREIKDAADLPDCPVCGKPMPRQWDGQAPAVIDDPEATMHDVAVQCQDMADGRTVRTRFLSQAIARVPGIRKVTGPDGRRYAFFRSKQDRRATLKRLGIESD